MSLRNLNSILRRAKILITIRLSPPEIIFYDKLSKFSYRDSEKAPISIHAYILTLCLIMLTRKVNEVEKIVIDKHRQWTIVKINSEYVALFNDHQNKVITIHW